MRSKPARPDSPSVTVPSAAVVAAQLSTLALTDLEAALVALQRCRAEALAESAATRAVVLAALGAQWIVSDFGSMTSIDAWTAGVAATPPLSLDGLEDHAALIYCAGVIALHQAMRARTLREVRAVNGWRRRTTRPMRWCRSCLRAISRNPVARKASSLCRRLAPRASWRRSTADGAPAPSWARSASGSMCRA